MRKRVIFIGIFILVILLSLIIRTSYSYYIDSQDDLLVGGSISVMRGDIDIATYVQDPNGEKEWGPDEKHLDHYTRIDTTESITSKYEFEYECIKEDAKTTIKYNYATKMFTVTSDRRNKCMVFFHLAGFATSVYVEDDSGTLSYGGRNYIEYGEMDKIKLENEFNFYLADNFPVTPKYTFEYSCTNGSTFYYKYCSKILEQLYTGTNDNCDIYFYYSDYLPSLTGDIVVYEKTYDRIDISQYTKACGYCEKDTNAKFIYRNGGLYAQSSKVEDICYMAGE